MGYTSFLAQTTVEQVKQLRRTIDAISDFGDLFVDKASKKEMEREMFYGSHMDERHSGLTEEETIKRLLHSPIKASSSYISQLQAHQVVSEILYAKAEDIIYFVNMGSLDNNFNGKKELDIKTEIIDGDKVSKLIFEEELEAEDPEETPYIATGITNDFRYMGTNINRLVIVKAPLNDMKFRILTCVPVTEKGIQLEPKSETLKKINNVLINDEHLTPLEKCMWLYREKGFQSFMVKNQNAIAVLFNVNNHTFSLKLDENSFGNTKPYLSLKTETGYDNAHTTNKIDETTRIAAVGRARVLTQMVYDKVMTDNIHTVSKSIIQQEKLKELREKRDISKISEKENPNNFTTDIR